MNVPRGPCNLPILREAWIHGVVDEHTLVWGKGLMDWLPMRNVRTLVPQVTTAEVRLAAWVKRTMVLGPALRAVRKQRKAERPEEPTEQVFRWKAGPSALARGKVERTSLAGVAALAVSGGGGGAESSDDDDDISGGDESEE